MKEKPKKLMNTIFLLLAINSVSMAKEVKEENEFIILGTEYKMSDKNKKLKKLSDTSSENEMRIPEIPDASNSNENDNSNETENLSDNTEGSGESSDNCTDSDASEDKIEKITVVKENGIVKAEKTVLGSTLNYETAENIAGNDSSALWVTDDNTSVALSLIHI